MKKDGKKTIMLSVDQIVKYGKKVKNTKIWEKMANNLKRHIFAKKYTQKTMISMNKHKPHQKPGMNLLF